MKKGKLRTMSLSFTHFLVSLIFILLSQRSNCQEHVYKDTGEMSKDVVGQAIPSNLYKESRHLFGGRKLLIDHMRYIRGTLEESGKNNSSHKKRVDELAMKNNRPLKEAEMGGIMALSADYHVPKPHPPKNN